MREIVGWAATALDADLQLRGEAYPEPDEIKRFFTALDAHELEQLLASGGVDGWMQRETVIPGESVEGGQELYKVFEFRNFRRAFTFMQLVAIRAEQFNHHPDWRNVWNRVFVSQRTWDAQHVITGLDFQMASYMNRAAAICNEDPSPNWPPRSMATPSAATSRPSRRPRASR